MSHMSHFLLSAIGCQFCKMSPMSHCANDEIRMKKQLRRMSHLSHFFAVSCRLSVLANVPSTLNLTLNLNPDPVSSVSLLVVKPPRTQREESTGASFLAHVPYVSRIALAAFVIPHLSCLECPTDSDCDLPIHTPLCPRLSLWQINLPLLVSRPAIRQMSPMSHFVSRHQFAFDT